MDEIILRPPPLPPSLSKMSDNERIKTSAPRSYRELTVLTDGRTNKSVELNVSKNNYNRNKDRNAGAYSGFFCMVRTSETRKNSIFCIYRDFLKSLYK